MIQDVVVTRVKRDKVLLHTIHTPEYTAETIKEKGWEEQIQREERQHSILRDKSKGVTKYYAGAHEALYLPLNTNTEKWTRGGEGWWHRGG